MLINRVGHHDGMDGPLKIVLGKNKFKAFNFGFLIATLNNFKNMSSNQSSFWHEVFSSYIKHNLIFCIGPGQE